MACEVSKVSVTGAVAGDLDIVRWNASDLNRRLRSRGRTRIDCLRAAPVVEHSDLVNAGNGAVRGAGFFRVELAMAALGAVLGERDAGIAALLGAVMNQTILANIEVARAGAAAPIVFAARGDIVLERIDTRERTLAEAHDFLENLALVRRKGLELAVAIVNDADRRGESQFNGSARDGEGVFGMMDAAAQHGIDVDVKIGVLGEQLQFLVEDLQAFLRDFVGLRVVDADLQEFETGGVETRDAIRSEQIAVGDHAGNHAVAANAADDVVEFGMQQRLAAADGDDGRTEGGEAVDAAEHLVERDGLREIVVFVAIRAREIAAADGNDVRQ